MNYFQIFFQQQFFYCIFGIWNFLSATNLEELSRLSPKNADLSFIKKFGFFKNLTYLSKIEIYLFFFRNLGTDLTLVSMPRLGNHICSNIKTKTSPIFWSKLPFFDKHLRETPGKKDTWSKSVFVRKVISFNLLWNTKILIFANFYVR